MAVTSSGDGNFSSVIAGGLSVNDDVIIDHDVTLDGDAPNVNSLTINPSKTFTGGGNTVTIDDKDGSAYSFRARNGSTISGTLNIKVTGNGGYIRDSATGSINNLEVDLGSSSEVHYLDTALSLTGNLTITEGIFNTNASSNHALTVAGALANDGTLTLNGSTVNLGSTSTEAGDVTGSGTFNLDTSTINYHTAGGANFIPSTSANFDTNTSTFNLIGLNGSNRAHNFTFASGNMHNITTSRGAGTDTHTDTLNGNCTITGNLTVGANSNFSSGTRVFTVNGDVNVTGQLICNGSNKPMEFGGLEIASGGTYNATSGTTTLTDKISSGTYTNYMFHNGGTFTHNKGTVHWKADTSSGTWYAMNGSTSATQTEFYNISTERVRASGTEQYRFWTGGSGRHLTVLNNIDIGANTRIFSSNGSGNFRNDGICDISGILNIVNVTTVNMGAVTIESGGELEFGDGNSVNVEGVRNVGGTVTVT